AYTLRTRRLSKAQLLSHSPRIYILDFQIFLESLQVHLKQACLRRKFDNRMDSFINSRSPGSDSKTLASSNENPPFGTLLERNPSKRQRRVYAQYRPLSKLFQIPGTFHWAVEVISDDKLEEDDSGYIWELAQEKGKITINVSSWTGAEKTRKELLGYTKLTDSEICDHGL
ncbi:MAG: hypothetical protein Q9214_001441, partial [Letrouitia sp. 1 TL-2023]